MLCIRSSVAALLAFAIPCALAVGCAGAGPANDTRNQDNAMKKTSTSARPASEITFRREEPWYSLGASFRAQLGFAQPIVQKEAATRAYQPDAVYAKQRDWSKLVIDLSCVSNDRAPDVPAADGPGPLASLAEVQVFGDDRSRPLAVFVRADLVLERGTANSFEHDGRGPIVVTIERVRLPFDGHAKLIRAGHPYFLTVVGLDAQGRTMVCGEIQGDELQEPIAAQPMPESGWTAEPKASPTPPPKNR